MFSWFLQLILVCKMLFFEMGHNFVSNRYKHTKFLQEMSFSIISSSNLIFLKILSSNGNFTDQNASFVSGL